jgi:hypothetical protein
MNGAPRREILSTAMGRKVIFDSRQLKTPLQYPMTLWKDPEAPHAVENLGKTVTMHLVRVEMKK